MQSGRGSNASTSRRASLPSSANCSLMPYCGRVFSQAKPRWMPRRVVPASARFGIPECQRSPWMMMMSPVIISLPFKIMLFVLVDGWAMVMGTLAASFGV